MTKSKFNIYRDVKSQLTFIYNGIEFNKILTPEFIQLIFWRDSFRKISYLSIIGYFFKRLKLNDLLNAFERNNIVVTNCSNRKDYLELIEKSLYDIDNLEHVKITSCQSYYSLFTSIEHLVKVIKYVFFEFNYTEFTFKEKMYLCSHMVYYANILDDLERRSSRIDFEGKKYIAFNSSFDLESLITLFLRQKSVATYHLSHGLTYVKYKISEPFDCVNGENICSENILVWGESSKIDLIENYKIDSKKIIVAGNPKYPFVNILPKTTFKYGIVFLGRSIYDKENIILLKLLGECSEALNIKFDIKIHPLSNYKNIENICKNYNIQIVNPENTISTLLSSGLYDFSVCYNTTVYYEAMYYGLFTLRYSYLENEQYIGLEDKFIDNESFVRLINKFKNYNPFSWGREIESLLVNTLGMGINEYKKILRNE